MACRGRRSISPSVYAFHLPIGIVSGIPSGITSAHRPSEAGSMPQHQRADAEHSAQLFRRHVNRTWAVMMGGRVECWASGSHVYSSRGERYLDCGGHGVLLLGHNHPAVVRAVVEQLGKQALSSRFLLSPIVAEAAARLI